MAVSARIRKRQYENAVEREKYLARTDRPIKTTVTKRPKTAVLYASYLIANNPTNSQLFEIQASERSITFFGGVAALGLSLASASTDPVPATPKFWTPAKVHAGVGLAAPTAHKSPWGSRVVKSHSASYSAPISEAVAVNNVTKSTYDKLDARAKNIYTALGTANLGDLSYASFYLSPEIFNNHKA